MSDTLESVSRDTPVAGSPQALALLAHKARGVFAEGLEVVPSPCISICKMNADRSLCVGCLRSLEEIRAWSRSDTVERQDIWRRLLARAGIETA
jgi:predicted Fe-S protein YdhL (DUF1289 family)